MPIEQVEYEEFKEKLPELMGKVKFSDGYQVIIAQHGVPFAKVTDYYDGPREIKFGGADGKFIIPDDFDTKLTPNELVNFCKEAGLLELPLKLEHVYTLETLTRPDNAPPHKNPFDRMLISQAKSEGMTFITHDVLLPYYNEHCILYV